MLNASLARSTLVELRAGLLADAYTELLPGRTVFVDLDEARLEVACYFDTYFNLDRRHSAPGYRSPHPFEHEPKNHLP